MLPVSSSRFPGSPWPPPATSSSRRPSTAPSRRARRASGAGPAHVFLHQAVFSAVLLALTKPAERSWLPNETGDPLHLHERVPAPSRLARTRALIGQRKEAPDALERADQAGIVDVFVLRRDEAFAPVEDDERFEALLKAIGVERYIAMLERKERDSFQKPDEVMRALALRPGERVADIGAGPGYFTLRVARAVGPSGEVPAIDYGPKPWSERPWGPPPDQKRAREEVDEAMATSGLVPSKVHEFLTEPLFVEYVAR